MTRVRFSVPDAAGIPIGIFTSFRRRGDSDDEVDYH